MNAPDATVVPFPHGDPANLHWQALSLANAARLAADALERSHGLAASLRLCAEESRDLADRVGNCLSLADFGEQVALCRSLSRKLAEL